MRRLTPLVLGLLALAALPAPAGARERDDRAVGATGPVTAPVVTGTLQSARDTDWYLLAPFEEREIEVLVSLLGGCGSERGAVRVGLYDADLTVYRPPLGVLRLGWDPTDPITLAAPRMAGSLRFTGIVGHRFLLAVRHRGCTRIRYQLDLTPHTALGARLRPTDECRRARRNGSRAAQSVACARNRLTGSPWNR
jgi:hypothetical protein